MGREVTNKEEAVLKVNNLSVAYSGVKVIDEISFSISKHQIVGIVGESGVGKSTIIKAINNNITYKGEVEVVSNKKTVYQGDNLLNWLSGFNNIKIGLMTGIVSDEKEKVEDVVKQLSIDHFVYKYPYEMSGGEKKRISIARAYVSNPELILMDEPFTGLDFFTKNKMHMELLRIWNTHRSSILFISHDIEEILLLCDKVLVLKDKKVLDTVEVDFPRPRASNLKFSKAFVELRKRIINLI